jgi:hypothetical protein
MYAGTDTSDPGFYSVRDTNDEKEPSINREEILDEETA